MLCVQRNPLEHDPHLSHETLYVAACRPPSNDSMFKAKSVPWSTVASKICASLSIRNRPVCSSGSLNCDYGVHAIPWHTRRVICRVKLRIIPMSRCPLGPVSLLAIGSSAGFPNLYAASQAKTTSRMVMDAVVSRGPKIHHCTMDVICPSCDFVTQGGSICHHSWGYQNE